VGMKRLGGAQVAGDQATIRTAVARGLTKRPIGEAGGPHVTDIGVWSSQSGRRLKMR